MKEGVKVILDRCISSYGLSKPEKTSEPQGFGPRDGALMHGKKEHLGKE